MSKVFGGRYEILERIGSGGMAIVYKAKDLLLNRVVTVKVLREQFATDEDFIRRFRREAQSAASLSHTNIVSIYDVGKDGDEEYIVMEYVEGRNLKEIIREYAPLSTEQAINLAMQIGEAISHAHEHKIIHRDIKPHNILVTTNGRAKVTDFGIARAVSSATVTHTGDIVGSVHYLSPEQAKGIQSNEQSDLYSLGIILYELLTGKVPYDGETPIAIALKHLQEEPLAPSKLNPRISPDLEAVILRAIAKSSQARYPTAGDFLADLRAVQAGRSIAKVVGPSGAELETTQVHKQLGQSIEAALPQENGGEQRGMGKAKKKKYLWPIIAVIILLVIGVGGLLIRDYLVVDNIKVPNLVGMTLPEAGIALQEAGLLLSSVEPSQEFSDTVDEGQIIRQEPKADMEVKAPREITVVVSKGPEMMEVPDVLQFSEENAVNSIRSIGFTNWTIKKIPSATVPEGSVIEQRPAGLALWSKNEEIVLTISSGTQLRTINMPDVIGHSSIEATATLKANNLVVRVDSQDSNLYSPDVVISTTPGPGEPTQEGAIVTIVVSRGPGPGTSGAQNTAPIAQPVAQLPDGQTTAQTNTNTLPANASATTSATTE